MADNAVAQTNLSNARPTKHQHTRLQARALCRLRLCTPGRTVRHQTQTKNAQEPGCISCTMHLAIWALNALARKRLRNAMPGANQQTNFVERAALLQGICILRRPKLHQTQAKNAHGRCIFSGATAKQVQGRQDRSQERTGTLRSQWLPNKTLARTTRPQPGTSRNAQERCIVTGGTAKHTLVRQDPRQERPGTLSFQCRHRKTCAGTANCARKGGRSLVTVNIS